MKRRSIADCVLGFVPIVSWLPKYDVRHNLLNDVIGGLTVGIMHVPQGMAYSSLAGVRPVNGLYTSLFPAFFYLLFGTSRHVSLGVFAIVTLLSGSCNLRVSKMILSSPNNSLIEELGQSEAQYTTSVEVLASLTLLVGLIQICMAVFRLDFLISFLSDQIIAGFTTGAAVHVFVAQLNKFLGVALPRHSGFGKLYFNLLDLYTSMSLGEGNLITLAISIATIAALFFMKEVIDPIYKKKCQVPMPYELFVMILGTILSGVFDLHNRFEVKIIGVIPTGLPVSSIPDVTLFPYFVSDALAIAVISLVVTVSMGKLFAKKHNYKVDVRQEFYAMGFMESLCSLFPVWPSSTALARTLVYEAAGTKTQFATVFSSALLLSVIFFVGPFVQVLPTCFLSCIIVVSLKGMFMQLRCIPTLWRSAKVDCAIFITTFVCTVLLEVVEGLIIGVLLALAVIIYRTLNVQTVELVEVDSRYRPIQELSESSSPVDGVCVVQFSSPLIFLNAENFRKSLDQLISEKTEACQLVSPIAYTKNEVLTKMEQVVSKPVRTIIIDLSLVSYVDYSGVVALKELSEDCEKESVAVFLVEVPQKVMLVLRTSPQFARLTSNCCSTVQNAIQETNRTKKT